jgi:hypothetical protein
MVSVLSGMIGGVAVMLSGFLLIMTHPNGLWF